MIGISEGKEKLSLESQKKMLGGKKKHANKPCGTPQKADIRLSKDSHQGTV